MSNYEDLLKKSSDLIDAFLNIIKNLNERINQLEKSYDLLYKLIDNMRKRTRMIGAIKLRMCAYNRDGYCYHPRFGSEKPHDWAKTNVKEGNLYFPQATEELCSICPFFVEKTSIKP